MTPTIIGGQAAVDKYRADYAWAAVAFRRLARAKIVQKAQRAILDHALPVRPVWAVARDRRV
jgi:hypothetical protein